MKPVRLIMFMLLQVACNGGWSALAAGPPAAPHRTFVIIHTESLKPAADEWAAYRAADQGGNWDIALHTIAPGADAASTRAVIQDFIRESFRTAPSRQPGDFTVLLLGDADSDSRNGDQGIPAWYFPQPDSVMRSGDGSNDSFATDHPYQLMDDRDDLPDIALGRVPARNLEEARAVLAKIKRYESPPTFEALARGGRQRITYVAGEGRFGPMDGVLEELFKQMVDRLVPEAFDISMTYAKASSIYCPPPSKLTETVLNRLNEGALLFNYIGHGSERGFDSLYWNRKRYPILRVADLSKKSTVPKPLAPDSAGGNPAVDAVGPSPSVKSATSATSLDTLLPIAFLSCCSVGWFDLPGGERCLSEELLFANGGAAGGVSDGAIAVISGTRVTHPYANTVMQMNVTKSLLVDREPTIGLLDLRATRGLMKSTLLDRQLDAIATPIARSGKWETSLRDLRQMHVKLYNLLGDPATRIPPPPLPIKNLKFEDGIVSGDVPGMKSGRVFITLETARTSFTQPGKLLAPIGDNDSDLEKKTANNYPLVNDRALIMVEGDVLNGRFAITVNNVSFTTATSLRAYAAGLNEAGDSMNARGLLWMITPAR